ncbi:unnamed protein product, partial [Brenthis ino]
MLVVFTLISLCIFSLNEGKIFAGNKYQNENLKQCVSHIIEKYFSKYSHLSVIDVHHDSDEIIEVIRSVATLSIILKGNYIDESILDESYLIINENATEFVNNLRYLKTDYAWNPNGRFLIIIKSLFKSELEQIFDTLLKYHIIDVLVLAEYFDPGLYTYNPFENYGCGRRYDRIIEFGKFPAFKNENLYPYKLVTGLRNCTFKVLSVHLPPYSIDPSKSNLSKTIKGIEEIILRQISELEQFSVEYRYDQNAEIFTTITSKMLAVGPMKSLQIGDADVILGGMILSQLRARAFNYIHNHLPFSDEFRYQVKKASPIAFWKTVYLEFHATVWAIFIFTFLVYLAILIILTKPKDIKRVILQMFGSLTEQPTKLRGNYFTKYFFIIWVWFAYIVSIYYTSSLVSLTANPLMEYQISNEKDIYKYNLKPCIGNVISTYINSAENITIQNKVGSRCYKLLDSIDTVSKSSDSYTITLYSIYKFHEHKFFDDSGKPMIYSFDKPLGKVIYAIYFYDGFPMMRRLNLHASRLRENGFVQYHITNLGWQNKKNIHFSAKARKLHVLVPWSIFICGHLISLVVFLLEIISNKLK